MCSVAGAADLRSESSAIAALPIIGFRFSSRWSSSQRDFFSTGTPPSLAIWRHSPTRISSSTLLIVATCETHRIHLSQHPVLQPDGDYVLHRVQDLVPKGAKRPAFSS